MNAHVGMITQWYDPERGSASTPGNIARSLVRRGHPLEVLTGFPNYPSGKVYPGYTIRPYQQEQMNGVTVHRAPLYPSHDSHPVRRAANYLSFASAASAVALGVLRRCDAVLVHSTPATVALPALALRALRRIPFVVHIQDLWPQTVTSSGYLPHKHVGRIEQTIQIYCDWVYRSARFIAVTSPGMAEVIERRGIRPSKIVFVPNWADEEAFRPVPKSPDLARTLGLGSSFTVMYAGNFGTFQALEAVIGAAALLRDRRDIQFALVGGGVEEQHLKRLVFQQELENVAFIPAQPFSQMSNVLALGDVQIISLKDLPLFRTTTPSKLQATLAAGRPIIAAVTGDTALAVERSGAGKIVPPGSAQAIAEAVLEMSALEPAELVALGSRGRRYYEKTFSETVAASTLSDLLERTASQKGPEGR